MIVRVCVKISVYGKMIENKFLKTVSIAISMLLLAFTYGCNSTPSGGEQESDNPDITIDSSYLIPQGGDPRGAYKPNTPFVQYFGSLEDSLLSNTASGEFHVSGSTPDSGDFDLRLTINVSGYIGQYIYASLPAEYSIGGTWSADGAHLILRHQGYLDSLAYTSDAKGIYFITQIFSNLPPIIDRGLDPFPDGPCVWIYKRY